MNRISRILVIDDNQLFAQTVQHMLRRKELHVDVAYDGLDGLARATASDYDLVIVDLIMPKLDGFDVIRRLKQEPTCPALIAMSGNVHREGEHSLESALELGADELLEKPFAQDTLFEAVFKALACRPLPAAPRLMPLSRPGLKTPAEA